MSVGPSPLSLGRFTSHYLLSLMDTLSHTVASVSQTRSRRRGGETPEKKDKEGKRQSFSIFHSASPSVFRAMQALNTETVHIL